MLSTQQTVPALVRFHLPDLGCVREWANNCMLMNEAHSHREPPLEKVVSSLRRAEFSHYHWEQLQPEQTISSTTVLLSAI